MYNQWEMIFFTEKLEEYIKIKYILFTNGINVKTKIISHREVGTIVSIGASLNESYQIYVHFNETEIANKIIHSKFKN